MMLLSGEGTVSIGPLLVVVEPRWPSQVECFQRVLRTPMVTGNQKEYLI